MANHKGHILVISLRNTTLNESPPNRLSVPIPSSIKARMSSQLIPYSTFMLIPAFGNMVEGAGAGEELRTKGGGGGGPYM
jgi:hypothetical protein